MLLVTAVIGSGIMAARLSAGIDGVALLANAIATGGALVALILAFGPISGAHMNPVVTAVSAARGERPWSDVAAYVSAQCIGGLAGTALAHAMFGLAAFTASVHERSGGAQFLGEVVATFGLVTVVLSVSRHRAEAAPYAVAAYITGAYWFTSSTSFANPAVTLARCFTDTFAGIRPTDAPAFVGGQVAGGAAAALLFAWLAPSRTDSRP